MGYSQCCVCVAISSSFYGRCIYPAISTSYKPTKLPETVQSSESTVQDTRIHGHCDQDTLSSTFSVSQNKLFNFLTSFISDSSASTSSSSSSDLLDLLGLGYVRFCLSLVFFFCFCLFLLDWQGHLSLPVSFYSTVLPFLNTIYKLFVAGLRILPQWQKSRWSSLMGATSSILKDPRTCCLQFGCSRIVSKMPIFKTCHSLIHWSHLMCQTPSASINRNWLGDTLCFPSRRRLLTWSAALQHKTYS